MNIAKQPKAIVRIILFILFVLSYGKRTIKEVSLKTLIFAFWAFISLDGASGTNLGQNIRKYHTVENYKREMNDHSFLRPYVIENICLLFCQLKFPSKQSNEWWFAKLVVKFLLWDEGNAVI